MEAYVEGVVFGTHREFRNMLRTAVVVKAVSQRREKSYRSPIQVYANVQII